ncbi:hypothetical protein EB796_002622 [Bugula neritina]|uniref:Uncharacterized protein n=1 Tax=Bugula neritina TaxID=10212 RepID=A0A7J7KLV6_BUGNE|nr:hypothetical protein EB796_002622 [Bugula neritina]
MQVFQIFYKLLIIAVFSNKYIFIETVHSVQNSAIHWFGYLKTERIFTRIDQHRKFCKYFCFPPIILRRNEHLTWPP